MSESQQTYRPQYETTAERIIEYITTAALKPGDRLPTEQKLGEQLGVSRSVIREAVKYLSATGLIGVRRGFGLYVADRSALVDRMSQIAQSMGFSLNAQRNHGALAENGAIIRADHPQPGGYIALNADHNGAKRYKVVDLIVNMLNTSYDYAVIQGVESVLYQNDIRPLLLAKYDENGRERPWTQHLALEGTDGVILMLTASDLPIPDALQQHRIPFVIVDSKSELDPSIPSVGATNWSGARVATEYLLHLGHRRIAIICGTQGQLSAQARLAGYRAALENVGITADPALVRPGLYIQESGYTQTLALLDLEEPPTAIFACNDAQAFGAYRAIYERGLRIPEDISVLGFDNDPSCEVVTPPLTTVHQPLAEMGRVAANMLIQLMNGQTLGSSRIEVATSLIQRNSCAPPRQTGK